MCKAGRHRPDMLHNARRQIQKFQLFFFYLVARFVACQLGVRPA